MANFIWSDAYLSVNGVDLSDHVQSLTVTYEAEQQDDTVMGNDTRSNKPGLKNWSIEVNFLQDYASNEVDATLFSLVGSTFAIIIKPVNTATGATNPRFDATGTLSTYNMLGGAVGDLAVAPVTIVPAGQTSATLARATSDP